MKLIHFLFYFLLFVSCKETNPNLARITAGTVAIDSTISSSTKIDSIVTPYREKLTTEMETVLSYAPKDLVNNDGTMQSSLGNLMADMCFEMGNPIFKEMTGQDIDFAMFNYGGLRSGIPEGEVTKMHAFNLMPFENELVVATLSGDKVMELVDYFMDSEDGHPLSKQVELTIEEDNNTLKINGSAFSTDKTYAVLTSDYLQNGGDNMNFFANPEKLTKLDVKVRDAILTYFKKVDTLKTTIDHRVILKK